jgi:hypothetical protein
MYVSKLKQAIKVIIEDIQSLTFNSTNKKPTPQPVFLTLKRRS